MSSAAPNLNYAVDLDGGHGIFSRRGGQCVDLAAVSMITNRS
jgi:hypothetical protein